MNRLYPVGIQNFEDLRSGGYIYVDKTPLLYNLVKTGKYYFLSRPRRFGKSLMISTLEAYFTGKRELFKGLDMERLEKDWTVYPVLHMDLNTRNYYDYESLVGILSQNLEEWEKLYGDEKKDRVPEERFMYVIKQACEKTGHKVVILIDEYDKPILQTISRPELADRIPEYPESILRRPQVVRRLHTICHAYRSDEIQQGQRVQRPEQPAGYIDGQSICRDLRNK